MYLPLSLFILFLSLNICTARPLVAVEEASSTQINISGKVPGNVKKQHSESNGGTKTEEIKVKNNIGGVKEERSQQKKKAHLKELESTKQREIQVSSHVPVKSVVSVSWSVPHGKQDQNPEFYSDYSRPRTRPPSHN